jgi:hypothetical protein
MEHCPHKGAYLFGNPFLFSDASCCLCSSSTDSLVHLFFSCPIARVIWRNSLWPLDIQALCISYMVDWLQVILHPQVIGIPASESHFFQIFAAVACDQIWYARNKAHHENLVPNALSISAKINPISTEHNMAWNSKVSLFPPVWSKPTASTFKINFDTTIREQFSAKSLVCRDSTGAIYMEASAALLAAQLSLSLKLPSVIFEGDSLMVTLAINNPSITQDWRISSIILDFLSTIPSSTSWSASHINRSANFCTHYIANWAATRFFSSCILIPSSFSISFPPCLGKKSSASFFVP